ncbi:hypothetical protein TNCV_1582481 [Trichonephila clavipes]|nr:hypothetical protein TNCV_1582481 [Trichonephila clavipes]
MIGGEFSSVKSRNSGRTMAEDMLSSGENLRVDIRPLTLSKKYHCGRHGLMVWTGIIADGYTCLNVLDRGTVTGEQYRADILAPHIRLFMDNRDQVSSL